MPSAAGTLPPEVVPLPDFQKLTRIPIVIYYGDNFPVEPTTERGQDNWRVRLAMGPGCGLTPSTGTAVTPAWCTFRRQESAATRTS